VHLYYGTLPGARSTLYKAICEVFFSRRQIISGSPLELRAEQRQLVVQPLAYTLMQRGERHMSRSEICLLLKAPLQSASTTQTPELFLDHLEALSSDLLLEREPEVYSFVHKTVQEYLAIIYIQKARLEQELLTHIEDIWWHEDHTAVLRSGRCNSCH